MIQVHFGNNVRKETTIVDEHTTIRDFFDEVGIDYSKGNTTLDGAPLQPGEINKTFADFGISEKCYLYNVVKVDNA